MSKKQILFLAIGAVLIFSATASSGERIRDSRNNFHIWNPDPEQDEEAVWNGQCFESYDTGYVSSPLFMYQ